MGLAAVGVVALFLQTTSNRGNLIALNTVDYVVVCVDDWQLKYRNREV